MTTGYTGGVKRATSTIAIAAAGAALAAAACGASSAASVDAAAVDAWSIDAPPGEPQFEQGPRRGRVEVMQVRGVDGQPAPAEAQAMFATTPTSLQFVFYARVGVMHWQAEVMRSGECRLLEPTPAFCTACTGVCVATETCEPYPSYASAGGLTFTGLVVDPFALAPMILGGQPYWYASQGGLGTGGFAATTTVAVRAAGDAVPAFALATPAVAPLVDDLVSPLTLTPGQDAEVTWRPAAGDARVRLRLNANNTGHAAPYHAIIECDSPDDGHIAIDRALIDRFPRTVDLGACVGSDCPPSTLTRYRVAAIDVGGAPVELVVGARRDVWLYRP